MKKRFITLISMGVLILSPMTGVAEDLILEQSSSSVEMVEKTEEAKKILMKQLQKKRRQ